MMNAWLPRILLPLAACHPSLAQADAPSDPRAAAPPPSARPSDEAIKAAVRATLAEMPASPTPATGQVLSGGAYREFARTFSQARKPHCLGPDPLKHQPHSFTAKTPLGDYVFGVGGPFALPFWGAAILRGKCSWTR